RRCSWALWEPGWPGWSGCVAAGRLLEDVPVDCCCQRGRGCSENESSQEEPYRGSSWLLVRVPATVFRGTVFQTVRSKPRTWPDGFPNRPTKSRTSWQLPLIQEPVTCPARISVSHGVPTCGPLRKPLAKHDFNLLAASCLTGA